MKLHAKFISIWGKAKSLALALVEASIQVLNMGHYDNNCFKLSLYHNLMELNCVCSRTSTHTHACVCVWHVCEANRNKTYVDHLPNIEMHPPPLTL